MTRRQREIISDGFESVAGGAKFLALGKTQVYKLVASGALTHATVGGKIVIPRTALREYAALRLQIGSIA